MKVTKQIVQRDSDGFIESTIVKELGPRDLVRQAAETAEREWRAAMAEFDQAEKRGDHAAADAAMDRAMNWRATEQVARFELPGKLWLDDAGNVASVDCYRHPERLDFRRQEVPTKPH